MNSMPYQLKVFNVVISFILMYVFTKINYNLGLSILFAILTSSMLFIFGGIYFSLIFIVLYIIYLTQVINKKEKTSGVIIKQTDVYNTSTKKPFICDAPQTADNIISYKNFRDEVDNRNFSISMFLYINGSNPKYKNKFENYRFRDWKSIFYLGKNEIGKDSDVIGEDSNGDTIELHKIQQIPGLWLKPNLNNIVLVINDGTNNGRLELDDVPLNEWFSITILVNSGSISLYKNCKLEKILSLNSHIPDTSDYNLYIANDGKLIKYPDDVKKNGFPGQMAYFKYYNFTLSQYDIDNYCSKYKSVLDKFQNEENNDIRYETSCLVTDSDIKSL